jgi:peptidoglycan hydrolase-like protein with peptidoglycan-binding domain
MKRFLTAVVTLLLIITLTGAAQNENSGGMTASGASTQNANKKRGPVFRANKDQIKQAQAILKQRGFYAGEQTGKLDDATRSGLRQYQGAENLKVTGTLNKVTLEKMSIVLTDKQRVM